MHEEGYFIVQSQLSEDCNEGSYGRPYVMGKRVLFIKKWTVSFNFHDEIMRIVSVW